MVLEMLIIKQNPSIVLEKIKNKDIN